jgi:hypothetical protein
MVVVVEFQQNGSIARRVHRHQLILLPLHPLDALIKAYQIALDVLTVGRARLSAHKTNRSSSQSSHKRRSRKLTTQLCCCDNKDRFLDPGRKNDPARSKDLHGFQAWLRIID